MLGFNALSSRGISGGATTLTVVALSMTALGTITFTGSALGGAYIPMSGSGGITFSGSPRLFVNQALSAAGSITFGGTPRLFVAGKPIVITALPQSYTVRAEKQNYTLTAMSQSFTIRGVR